MIDVHKKYKNFKTNCILRHINFKGKKKKKGIEMGINQTPSIIRAAIQTFSNHRNSIDSHNSLHHHHKITILANSNSNNPQQLI